MGTECSLNFHCSKLLVTAHHKTVAYMTVYLSKFGQIKAVIAIFRQSITKKLIVTKFQLFS